MNDELAQELSSLQQDIIQSVKNIETLIQPKTNRNLVRSSEFDEILALLNEINSNLENAMQHMTPQDTLQKAWMLDEKERLK